MEIFISWSGERSKKVADALADWIPNVIQAAKPFVSDADIDKGARWLSEISEKLETLSFGIICVTADNLSEPWLLFEAGALSKFIKTARVCPYLLDMRAGDILGPLGQFQASEASKPDTLKLLRAMNKSMTDGTLDGKQLEKAFERWWPDLEKMLNAIPASEVPKPAAPKPEVMLLDILSEVRFISRSLLEERQSSTFAKQIREALLSHPPWDIPLNQPIQGVLTPSQSELLDFLIKQREGRSKPQKDNEPGSEGD